MNATYLQQFLSDAARSAKRSEIRELLKLISRPEVISLAGGLPSPETFPIEDFCELTPRALREHGRSAFQYGATEGDPGLLDQLVKLCAAEGIEGLDPSRILITSASQQGLDLVSRVFLAPGDVVVCELPSYLGALAAFAACGARMHGVAMDDQGIIPDLLEEKLLALRRARARTKLLYLVPDFQNPAGVTLSLERRRDVLAIAREFDLLVIEDTPYRRLRYVGETLPTLSSLDSDGRVISLFTFSKILSPGVRLGWVVADPDIIARLTVAKQAVDLCTSSFTQVLVREYLATGRIDALIERSRGIYAEKRRVILDALDAEMDPSWGVKWTRPEGGLFLWMTLPPPLDAHELFRVAIEENVAFVSGTAFHCDGGGRNTLRINFSYSSPAQLRTAVQRLARAIGRLVAGQPAAHGAASPRRLPVVDEGHSLEMLPWSLALTEVVQ
ncbi:MAG: PLP-dependent aminotransferase family protein [bacterium]